MNEEGLHLHPVGSTSPTLLSGVCSDSNAPVHFVKNTRPNNMKGQLL